MSKQNRWRPRFSLRTLLVLMTLMCVYFGCWEITKRYGVQGVEAAVRGDTENCEVYDFSSPLPFVVGFTDNRNDVDLPYPDFAGCGLPVLQSIRKHQIWFCGWTIELPVRWEVEYRFDDRVIDMAMQIEYPEYEQPHVAGR